MIGWQEEKTTIDVAFYVNRWPMEATTKVGFDVQMFDRANNKVYGKTVHDIDHLDSKPDELVRQVKIDLLLTAGLL